MVQCFNGAGLRPWQGRALERYDAKAKQLVWRGIAQGTLSNNGDKNQNLVHKAVEKMFKKYPKT